MFSVNDFISIQSADNSATEAGGGLDWMIEGECEERKSLLSHSRDRQLHS